jgi:hypothetical protein
MYQETDPPQAQDEADQLQQWFPPRLQKLDFEGTESAKFPGTSEVPTFYNSPPVC